MKTRTRAAFQALFTRVKDNPESAKFYAMVQDAVEKEIDGLETAVRDRSRNNYGLSLLGSVAGRAVLERAWAADPARTELDLISAGYRDAASELGAWWAGEEHRKRQAELARARGVGGGGVTDHGLTLGS